MDLLICIHDILTCYFDNRHFSNKVTLVLKREGIILGYGAIICIFSASIVLGWQGGFEIYAHLPQGHIALV